jgi:hypothetical protein
VNATNTQKIIAAALTGLLWLAAIAGMHYFPDVKDPLLAFTLTCSSIIMLLTGAHMNGQAAGAQGASQAPATPASPVVPAGQAGRLVLSLMIAIAIGVVLLAGCAGPANMWAAATMQKVESDVRGTDENLAKGVVDVFCHMPRDVFLRHPELQAPADLMCGQLASGAKIDPAQLTALFTSLQRAGVTIALPGAVALPPAGK